MADKDQKPVVPIDDELQRFGEHLGEQGNKRILFSAGFGAGKTYFLERFFAINTAAYHCVNLYPVDYSVTPNEDVFEIIKFDILDALLGKYRKEIDLSEEDISQGLITQEFLRNEANYYKIFKVFAKHIVPLGEALTDVLDRLKETFNAHNTFTSQMREKASEGADKFIKMMRERPNSIREMDGTTLLIRDFLGRVKSVDQKPVVLVIDDLDRLDPEHIFRLFNVFTAHHDSRTEQNKFGFDKVIFVCDVNNIEHMFHHRFGAKAEFSGYVDKFYSNEIFQFRHKSFLKDLFHDMYIRPKAQFEQDQSRGIPLSHIQTLSNGHTLQRVFQTIVAEMIGIDAIRVRNLVKFSDYRMPDYVVSFNGVTSFAYRFPFLTIVSLCRQLLPRIDDLQQVLEGLSANYHSDYSMVDRVFNDEGFGKSLIDYALPFIDPYKVFNHNITAGDGVIFVKNEHGRMYELHYSLKENHEMGGGDITYKIMTAPIEDGLRNGNKVVYKPNCYFVFLHALKFCRENGLIY